MGNSSIAAVVAVFLAVVMTALWVPTEAPMTMAQPEWHSEQQVLPDAQARHTLRSQAWATELFGRRYGRNLLA
jgi:hypothetical protein